MTSPPCWPAPRPTPPPPHHRAPPSRWRARMRRAARPNPTQLTLRLAPEPEPPLMTTEEPTLLQALADLLLEVLAQPTPGRRTKAATQSRNPKPQPWRQPMNPKIAPD